MVLKTIKEAFTTVKDTVKDIRDETMAVARATDDAAKATVALDKSVVRVLNTAEEEASKFGKLLEGLKGLGSQPVIKDEPSAPLLSARESADLLRGERIAQRADEPEGPANGRGIRDWRDRFGKAGYQQEAETAPTSSPSP